jgi:hypothetical protein
MKKIQTLFPFAQFILEVGDIIHQKSNNSLFYIVKDKLIAQFGILILQIACNLSIAKKYLLTSLQLLNKDF